MEQDFQMPLFSKALLTAVFVGIMATLLTMSCDLYFVKELEFPLSEIINVATLIFAVNLIFLVIGFVYYWFISAFKKGEVFFILLFILLTVFGVWKAEGVHRTDDQNVNSLFRGLLSGIIIIVGILASLGIPFLFHNKKFQKNVI